MELFCVRFGAILPKRHGPKSVDWIKTQSSLSFTSIFLGLTCNLREGKLFLCHLNQPLLSQRFKGSVLKQERAL
jgi:hypothetical protein